MKGHGGGRVLAFSLMLLLSLLLTVVALLSWQRYSLSLYTLAQFGSHAWVHLYNGSLFSLFEDTDGQVTSTWTDFEHHVGRLEVGLVDDTLSDERVLENVLTELVGVEDRVLGGGARVLVGGVSCVRVGCGGASRAGT